jgi:catechol 2,3-dioxygenase-like lactoylglutathione lyase family enzyme
MDESVLLADLGFGAFWRSQQLRKIWQAPLPTSPVISPFMTNHVTTLGAFSVSLAVKDLKASQAFYEKLGFKSVMGEPTQNWLILRNGTITLGLFQGMFDRNTFTFNPGWSAECERLPAFTDVREIQKDLKAKGLALDSEADESTTGPASLMLTDPDGNPILIDQHVDSPPKQKKT